MSRGENMSCGEIMCRFMVFCHILCCFVANSVFCDLHYFITKSVLSRFTRFVLVENIYASYVCLICVQPYINATLLQYISLCTFATSSNPSIDARNERNR